MKYSRALCPPRSDRQLPRSPVKSLASRLSLVLGYLVAACGFLPSTASAQVGVATWNVAWLMDAETHGRWTKACQAIGWFTEDELKAKGLPLPKELVGLPYCDVHDGIDYTRKAECLKTVGPNLKNRPNALDSPDGKCRLSPDLADWSAFETKLRTLRETFQAMDRDGVNLIGIQEVFGEAAVRQILPAGWEVKSSASLTGAPQIPQHVALAWKTSVHTPRDFQLISELSAIGNRPLRPGLQFTLDVAGKPVAGLVVHLKSGCRSVALDQPKRPTEKDACPVLAQQVPVVERWIDQRVGRDFVILGDFNRTLLQELEKFPQPDPKRFGATPAGQAQWVAPEWNDDDPKGSLVTVVPHKKKDDGKLIAGDFFCAQTTGIDHVILSQSLAQRLKPVQGPLELLPVSYRLDGKRLPVGKTTVPPSDHCARFVRLKP